MRVSYPQWLVLASFAFQSLTCLWHPYCAPIGIADGGFRLRAGGFHKGIRTCATQAFAIPGVDRLRLCQLATFAEILAENEQNPAGFGPITLKSADRPWFFQIVGRFRQNIA